MLWRCPRGAQRAATVLHCRRWASQLSGVTSEALAAAIAASPTLSPNDNRVNTEIDHHLESLPEPWQWRWRHLANPGAARTRDGPLAPPPPAFPLTPSGQASSVAAILQWDGYTPTPLISAPSLAADAGVAGVWLKDESDRFGTGSFKVLGGGLAASEHCQRAATSAEKPTPVVTASAGNHAIAVAWGCRQGVAQADCHVFLHSGVPAAQEERLQQLGAVVRRHDGSYEGSVDAARRFAETNGWQMVQDVADPRLSQQNKVDPVTLRIFEGYTVLASEMVDQFAAASLEAHPPPGTITSTSTTECAVPTEWPTHVFVNGGVGGLAAAVSGHLWTRLQENRPRIVVVEPLGAECLLHAAAEGCPPGAQPPPLPASPATTIQVGLDCKVADPLAWRVVSPATDHFVAIGDECVAWAQHCLAQGDPPVLAGDSGVAGVGVLLAAAQKPELRAALDLTPSSRVAVIICEGQTAL